MSVLSPFQAFSYNYCSSGKLTKLVCPRDDAGAPGGDQAGPVAAHARRVVHARHALVNLTSQSREGGLENLSFYRNLIMI